MPPIAIHIALGLALIESIGLALLLAIWARSVAGGRLLVLFLIGVAIWITGNELPSWFGPVAEKPANWLIAFASVTAAVFLHFAIRFCDAHLPRLGILIAYGLAAGTTLVAIVLPPGRFGPWAGLPFFFQPNALGWIVGLIWALFGALGHLVMLLSWIDQRGLRRRQIAAVFAASAVGLLSMTGYAFAALDLDIFPYPLLLLPAYPVILVYGILRYQLMVVNGWARRALAFTLLAASGTLVIALLTLLVVPFDTAASGWRVWLTALVALYITLSLVDPLRRLALRIIYPGSEISEATLAGWRDALAAAGDFAQLAETASRSMSRQLRTPIAVYIEKSASLISDNQLALVCMKRADRWQTELSGWEGAPPGPHYVATLFGAILAEAARQLEVTLERASVERERQQQARLAELGTLAAIVAHDIRNPLNIISMAAATASTETRKEIGIQVQRISRLSQDLLDYSKSWQLDRRRLDMGEQLRTMAAQHPEIELDGSTDAQAVVDGDPRRLQQVLNNLIDNARAAGESRRVRIAIGIDRGDDSYIKIHVCDDGPGIPADIRDTLFQPFVSRSPNGTGLGLAIVAKIMEAHGGRSELTERPGWSTCFTLSFPAAIPTS